MFWKYFTNPTPLEKVLFPTTQEKIGLYEHFHTYLPMVYLYTPGSRTYIDNTLTTIGMKNRKHTIN